MVRLPVLERSWRIMRVFVLPVELFRFVITGVRTVMLLREVAVFAPFPLRILLPDRVASREIRPERVVSLRVTMELELLTVGFWTVIRLPALP